MQKELLDSLTKKSTLDDIQNYVRKIREIRGFNNQNVELVMMLLMEEVGELAKAIRKDDSVMKVDKLRLDNYGTVEHEIADVFIVLMAICDILNINLFDSLKEKEKINITRNWEK